jgi:hypothetical protein
MKHLIWVFPFATVFGLTACGTHVTESVTQPQTTAPYDVLKEAQDVPLVAGEAVALLKGMQQGFTPQAAKAADLVYSVAALSNIQGDIAWNMRYQLASLYRPAVALHWVPGGAYHYSPVIKYRVVYGATVESNAGQTHQLYCN